MVRGIDSFREWFRGYEEQYAIAAVAIPSAIYHLQMAAFGGQQGHNS